MSSVAAEGIEESPRIHVRIERLLLDEIDAFAAHARQSTPDRRWCRSAALRHLVLRGLAAEGRRP